jgi:hypothetical protein
MQIELQNLTYAACGLSAVLDQATEQLGYDWDFCNGNLGQLTTEGRQYCIRMTNSGRSVGYICGRPFFWHCEAKESAHKRALTVRYIIRDINYNIWLQRYINVRGPIDPGSDSDSN